MKYHGIVQEEMTFNDHVFLCEWEVTGEYEPARYYLSNGDPGYPEELHEEIVLTAINGWPAEAYLARLKFWNVGAWGMLTEHHPDTEELRDTEDGVEDPDFEG